MAKISVHGDSLVITSALKLSDLKDVAKFNPKALVLMGGEDGKEPVFAVGVAKSGHGCINTCTAAFAPDTRDSEGKATITMLVGSDVADVEKMMVDQYGAALMNLAAMEEKLPEAIAKLAADKQAVKAMFVTSAQE